MPRRRTPCPPSYCLHKASGQAVVRLNGKDVYLGTHGSPESHSAYARVIAEFSLPGATSAQPVRDVDRPEPTDLTISQVILRYRDFAKVYYSKDGEPTKEYVEVKYTLRVLRLLYGDLPARDFGPKKLKAVRQHMIDERDWSRGVVNKRIKRIQRFFKWAVSEELVPASVWQGVSTVTGLRRGRTTAREAPPVKPVDDHWVDLVVPELTPPVAAMVQVQRLTGMRPGEVVLMRPCDLDRSLDVWVYQPHDHKSQWREQGRFIPLGPKAQAILQPFLDRPAESYLFSPQESEAWRHEQRAENRSPDRKTKVYPCELRARERRKAKSKKRVPKRPKRERYDRDSYRRAITYAIDRLNEKRAKEKQEPIPKWFPLQLRHTRGTEVRKGFGIEAAQVSLGHLHADVTQVYAERNLQLAMTIAQETG